MSKEELLQVQKVVERLSATSKCFSFSVTDITQFEVGNFSCNIVTSAVFPSSFLEVVVPWFKVMNLLWYIGILNKSPYIHCQ